MYDLTIHQAKKLSKYQKAKKFNQKHTAHTLPCSSASGLNLSKHIHKVEICVNITGHTTRFPFTVILVRFDGPSGLPFLLRTAEGAATLCHEEWVPVWLTELGSV